MIACVLCCGDKENMSHGVTLYIQGSNKSRLTMEGDA